MTGEVLVVGEALIDVVVHPSGAIHEHVGGSPLNVAKGLGRLGVPITLLTQLGPDARGNRIMEELEAAGVTLIAAPGVETSVATARLDESGAAHYEFELEWTLRPTSIPPGISHVHFGSLGALLEPGSSTVTQLVKSMRSNATVSYDPNLRPAIIRITDAVRQSVEALVALSHVVKASDEDIALLYGDDLQSVGGRWAASGPRVVMITRGGNDTLVWVDGQPGLVAVPPVAVADTVGAGDAFTSGFLASAWRTGLLGVDGAIANGSSLEKEVQIAFSVAAASAAITVERSGAHPPTSDELRAFLERGKPESIGDTIT